MFHYFTVTLLGSSISESVCHVPFAVLEVIGNYRSDLRKTKARTTQEPKFGWSYSSVHNLSEHHIECFTITHVLLGRAVYHLFPTNILSPEGHHVNSSLIVNICHGHDCWILG